MAPADDFAPAGSQGTGTNKRPRPSTGAPSGSQTGTPAAQGADYAASGPRTKRKKPDNGIGGANEVAPSRAAGRGRGKAAAQGDDRDKDDEGEVGDGEIVTKIDFKTLPPETLYRYLEQHELLPKWPISPWSEEPVTQPHMLYAPVLRQAPASPPPTAPTPAGETDRSTSLAPGLDPNRASEDPQSALGDGGAGSILGLGPEDESAPAPTTRSKTAPGRKAPTPPPVIPGPEYRTRVMTLSDVIAARDVLAEKANVHWAKGLGGGQNKESETIVNFLYKNKVGAGRLLRVYNPAYPAYGHHHTA